MRRAVLNMRHTPTYLPFQEACFRAPIVADPWHLLPRPPSGSFLCCRYQEGELALTGALFPGSNTDVAGFYHTAGAAYSLLGDICKYVHV